MHILVKMPLNQASGAGTHAAMSYCHITYRAAAAENADANMRDVDAAPAGQQFKVS